MRITEKIVAAACRKDGKVWTGIRHNEIIEQMIQEGGLFSIDQIEQGFLTSEGRFVSRYDAALIAFGAGQVDILKNSLSSEDLW